MLLPQSAFRGKLTSLKIGSLLCAVSLLASITLTGTSIAPVLLVYAVVGFFECEYLSSSLFALAGLILIGLWVGLFWRQRRHLTRTRFSFTSVEIADKENFGLLAVYLLPLLRTSFSDLEWLVLVPAVAIFLALAITGHNYHFNPLLKLSGWNFYKVGTSEGVTYVLVTRKTLRRAMGDLEVGELTDYTLIDWER